MSGCNTGVRKRVTDVNLKAIYIHCHAHQLNLALVDSCKTLDHASEFISLLQSLYNYLLLFLMLCLLGIVQLKKLSDTQWSCRYTSIKAVLTSLFAIIATLDKIGDHSHDRAIEARGSIFSGKVLSLSSFSSPFGESICHHQQYLPTIKIRSHALFCCSFMY